MEQHEENRAVVKINASESLILEITALLETEFYPERKSGILPNDNGESYHRFLTLTKKEVTRE